MNCEYCKNHNETEFTNQYYSGFLCEYCHSINVIEHPCNHAYRFALLQKKNNTKELKNICTKCFEREQKGYKIKDYDLTGIKTITFEVANNLRYQKYEYRKEIYEQLNHKKNTDWRYNYEAYLQTTQWAAKRVQVFRRDNFKCQICYGKAEEVHHITYKNLHNEYLFELTSLCRSCHSKYHGK
mgnify:CR=1 FL=1